MTGIIIADANEMKSITWKKLSEETINQFTFFKYKKGEEDIVLVHSGIGLANAAAATQQLISSFKLDKIINFGAVGAYGDTLEVYQIVKPGKIYYHDVQTPWYDRGQTPGEKPYFLNATQESLFNLASGGSFVTDEKEIENISNIMNVNLFDMESAAIFQIADKNKIPCFSIKVVSDLIGKNLHKVEDINERITQATSIAFSEMEKYI